RRPRARPRGGARARPRAGALGREVRAVPRGAAGRARDRDRLRALARLERRRGLVILLQPTAETIKALQAIAEEPFEATDGIRTTIRVETPNDRNYPVLAEARAPGAASLTGGMSPTGYRPTDLGRSPAIQRLRDERGVLVHEDVRVGPP